MGYNKVWYTTREKQYFLEELEAIKWAISGGNSEIATTIDALRHELLEVLWSNTRPNSDFQTTNKEALHKLIDSATGPLVSVVVTDWGTNNQQRFYVDTDSKQPIEGGKG